jgi:phenylalanyl-tRNA synthetase alpha chain
MNGRIEEVCMAAENAIRNVASHADLDAAKSKFLGPNGAFRELIKSIPTLAKEDRQAAGQAVNAGKSRIEEVFQLKLDEMENKEAGLSFGAPVDPTLSKISNEEIYCHPLTKIRKRIVEIFAKLGFSVAEGSEVETEWFCFDALNTPESHPSREESDTFYLPNDLVVENVSKKSSESYLLRTHTSTVQIRTMLREQPPIRILSPGRVFRRDAIDATHFPMFHQCEGLVVEDGATVCDLKSTLDFLFTELIGKGCETRMRPSYFPFVSPGFEVDFRSDNLGKLSGMWIEIGGCGMVAPNVFKNCGYGENMTGFAFGMGLERIAMLLYGIDDIRLFFQNDTRFLRQFKSSF